MALLLSFAGPQTQPTAISSIQQLWSDNGMMAWFSLLGFIFLGVVTGRVAQSLFHAGAGKARDMGWSIRGLFLDSVAAPANLFILAGCLSFGLAMLRMGEDLRGYSARSIVFLYILCLAWAAYNLVAILTHALQKITAATESKLDDQLVPLVRKALRIFVVVLFALFTAKNIFGADISAWLTGLGIAGLAVSLAAQESIKNLFGSVTILLDQPFAVGDLIRFGSHEGTVEEIGFRSTKVRTPDGFVITVPNSKIADDSVVNVTRRRNIRRLLDIAITYDTPPEKIRRATEIVQEILQHPDIAPSLEAAPLTPIVAFNDLGAASLNIRVIYWFKPPDARQWLAHSQRFNLMLIERFTEAGIDFAFPTQTLYLAGDAKRPLQTTPTPNPNRGDLPTF